MIGTVFSPFVSMSLTINEDLGNSTKYVLTVSSVFGSHLTNLYPDFRGFWLEKPEDPKKAGYRFVRWEPNKKPL